MKSLILTMLLAITGLLSAREFNVRDYGAKGDGKNDDTAAVQAAADAAVKTGKSVFSHRSIYFPPGTYRLKGSITLKNLSLRGEDAVIQQSDKTAVSFNYTDFWSVRITGITFNGGKGHVSVNNDNLDKSLFFVDHCRFFHCSGTALQTRHGAQSCLFTVKNCEFIRCICSIDSDSDVTAIRDTWIMNDEKMFDSAVIVNRHGVMTLDNMMGIPLCNGSNQRWVDNYGAMLVANNCRFGGEGGGFTPVYHYRKYGILPKIMNTVVLRDCQIFAESSNLRNCAVYCFEIPNLISLENNVASLTAGVLIDPKLKTDRYFYGSPEQFRYREHGNVGFREELLPPALTSPKIHPDPLPPEHLQGDALERKIREYKVQPSPGTCELNALTQPGTELVLESRMDGSYIRNSELLAIVRKAGPACLMRRRNGNHGDAPFVELKHVKVDLDKTPYLLIDFRSAEPAEFAIKFIDEDTGKLVTFRAQQLPIGRFEVDLPKSNPEFKGKKTYTMLIYYIGQKYFSRQGKTKHHYKYAKAGSVLEIHELGFNSNPRIKTKGK